MVGENRNKTKWIQLGDNMSVVIHDLGDRSETRIEVRVAVHDADNAVRIIQSISLHSESEWHDFRNAIAGFMSVRDEEHFLMTSQNASNT